MSTGKAVILAHGGVGSRVEDSDGAAAACRAGAAQLGVAGVDAALAAVVAAALVLEDDPRFNAGTGSNLRIDGSVEQDAMIATDDGRIGAVACLSSTKNPVLVAREVMSSPHVMLCGDGATRFARMRGFPAADVTTEKSLSRWKEALARRDAGQLRASEHRWSNFHYRGTIGAVARAADGRMAAASSTGGTSLMLPGRIGDTPIYGAGMIVSTRAAIVATGDGEEIIRRLSCSRVHARIVAGASAADAAAEEIAAFPTPWVIGLLIVTPDDHAIAATEGRMAAHAWIG